MDRYRVAPARPVCLSGAGTGGNLLAPPRGAGARHRSGGAEIGIFTAERYFSAADAVSRRDAGVRPDALPDHAPPRMSVPVVATDVASQSGHTTAASSEASWNSRSGLLSSGHHSAAARHRGISTSASGRYGGGGKKPGNSGQRWTLFGRDCPCAGRKAVTVDVASEPRSPTRFSAQSAVEECLEIFKVKDPSPPPTVPTEEEPGKQLKVTVTPGSRAFPLAAAADVLAVAASAQDRGPDVPADAFAAGIAGRRVVSSGGTFTFPALGAARFTSASTTVVDEPPRESLDVFRPIDEESVVVADPPPPAMPVAGRGVGLARALAAAAVVDEEAMSDASSDLFDLESFAASSSYPTTTYRGRGGSRRNSADDDLPPYASAAAVAEPALSECMYAPSEVSVVWSVATADGGGAFDAASVANFSSAASACCVDDLRFAVPESPAAGGFTAAMSRSAGRKKAGGGFLNSCRCEKAVNVGPTPVRVVKPPPYPMAAAETGGRARRHPGRVHAPVRT